MIFRVAFAVLYRRIWSIVGKYSILCCDTRPDGVEIRGIHNISAEEQSKLLADVAAYKARISFLESKLVELGFTEDASNDDSVVWAE
jgi:hypothetical protein